MHRSLRGVLLLVFALSCPVAAQEHERVVRVPGPGGSTLVAAVKRPPGEARHPLIVINHGSPADDSQRAKMEPPH